MDGLAIILWDFGIIWLELYLLSFHKIKIKIQLRN